MRYYTAIIHKDEGSAYGLTFPDLPGAFAAADTWDDIPKAATEALDLWFEDQPDVAPAPLDAVRARPDVAAELAAGAVLMPVPYIAADTALERVNISIERGLLRAIDETAKSRKMTRSSFLASAARRELVGAG
ncbi:CopG family transcriptional regulator [Ketogulonicigenium robustum]|uniref:CopG family transcriptional regulator n=1 Tax=Ketogulonicigenium robustum TaxID=92947 RepID=A0A1W6NYW9_9RHOB|nr:type II toxin-antitoxin system HicB family antitoxin [Ketogulonicigenium robustum]ARO14448.1 CopG family transcriptional regulator [Ketogulonicigenium robustum]